MSLHAFDAVTVSVCSHASNRSSATPLDGKGVESAQTDSEGVWVPDSLRRTVQSLAGSVPFSVHMVSVSSQVRSSLARQAAPRRLAPGTPSCGRLRPLAAAPVARRSLARPTRTPSTVPPNCTRLDLSVNCRRGRRGLLVAAIVDIVSAFPHVSTNPRQAQNDPMRCFGNARSCT